MPKYNLNKYRKFDADEVATIIEAEDGYLERKLNGNVWVKKPSEKQIKELRETERKIEKIYEEKTGKRLYYTDFFDHVSFLETIDGQSFILCCPYHSYQWCDLVPDIWGAGIYLKSYKNIYPCGIVVRYRRDDDDKPNVEDFRY